MRWVIIALGLLASPAIAADQFDLVCTAKKDSERYRVDLAKGEWCFGECKMVQKIASVTTGLIVLAEHEPTDGDKTWSFNRINRFTGEWSWYHSNPRSISVMDISGHCVPAEFSGMPAQKF